MIILKRNQLNSFEVNARTGKNTLLLTTNGHTLSLTQSQSPVATRLKHNETNSPEVQH